MGRHLRTVSVSMEYVDHDHGHWCNTCQRSTGLRVWVMLTHGDRMHLQQRFYCTGCAGHDVTVATS